MDSKTDSDRSLLWRVLSKTLVADCKVFSVSSSRSESECPQRKQANFFTLNCDPWVNVIAVDDRGSVLMIEQFRHGVGGLTLEVPGGCIDPTDADPLAGAVRELREETGCISESWSSLGKNHPNPAIQDNVCYTFLAESVKQVEEPSFDHTGNERISSRYVPLNQVTELIRSGAISHALVIVAFHFLAIERPDLFSM
ncbi:NUDIX hydrolase [soil metagenome]